MISLFEPAVTSFVTKGNGMHDVINIYHTRNDDGRDVRDDF